MCASSDEGVVGAGETAWRRADMWIGVEAVVDGVAGEIADFGSGGGDVEA